MKHATKDLTGALLDAAVAKAQGMEFEIHEQKVWGDGSGITIVHNEPACFAAAGYYEPSSDWRVAGPIIEREKIELLCRSRGGKFIGEWLADLRPGPLLPGPTPLIAAMRAYVAAALGDEVELP